MLGITFIYDWLLEFQSNSMIYAEQPMYVYGIKRNNGGFHTVSDSWKLLDFCQVI